MTPQEFDVIRAAIKAHIQRLTSCLISTAFSCGIECLVILTSRYVRRRCRSDCNADISSADRRNKDPNVRSMTLPKIKDAGEAWGDVQRAIQKYGYYRADEAMTSLSGPTKEAVERIGFRELCLGDNTVANRAHFFKIYDAILQRKINDSRLPELVLKKKTEYMLNCAEQEKPAAIEDRAKEPEVNVSTPEFIDRLLREKGLR